MIKYMLTAMALKAFSATSGTRKFYRELGNVVGSKRRVNNQMPVYYYERVNRTLALNRKFGFPRKGDRLLEIGTGWLHWEAIVTRLFFDIEAVLYDVWDNRQIEGMKSCIRQLDSKMDQIDATEDQKVRAQDLIARILEVASFRELYDLLGFEYRVDPEANLGQLGLGKFDVIVSAGVLEHVPKCAVGGLVEDMSGLLNHGGYSVHSINIRDHLYPYDRSVAQKQYLAYSEKMWKTLFENRVQYINRMQRSEWLDQFNSVGLELVDEVVEDVSLAKVAVDECYHGYDVDDLCCGGLRVVHQKN